MRRNPNPKLVLCSWPGANDGGAWRSDRRTSGTFDLITPRAFLLSASLFSQRPHRIEGQRWLHVHKQTQADMAQATKARRGNAPTTTQQHLPSNIHQPLIAPKHIPSSKKALPTPSSLPTSPLSTYARFRNSKTPRSHQMPTFRVPDDDTDSCVSEQDMRMEVDGHSFADQIDGLTRVQCDPSYQDQQRQNAIQAQQRTAEQQEPAHTPTQQHHNFRAARPMSSRAHMPFTSHVHDQHMLDSDVPSSIGKRKRSESQPPARDTYQPEPQIIEPQDPHNPRLRRIGGMIVTVYAVATTVLAGIWNYFTALAFNGRAQNAQENVQEQQEIVAVETDTSGRKRRAVPNDSNLASPSQSPRSQGPNSPSPPATEPAAIEPATTALDAPGAFPDIALPTPEGSQSPVREQPQARPETNEAKEAPHAQEAQETQKTQEVKKTRAKPERARKSKTAATMPGMYKYNNPTVDSIEPTLAEMRERFKHKKFVTPQDWEDVKEEKRQERARREQVEYETWAVRTDQSKRAEEQAFWEQEEESEQTHRLQAKQAAARVKFGDEFREVDLGIHEISHEANHTKGECGGQHYYQKIHEFHGLGAHNTAKVVEAEVARDTEEWNNADMSPEQLQAFQKTSAFKKFNLKKARADPEKALKQGEKPQRKAVAAARKASKGKGPATATREEPSRPTTSSSHKQASYKGGLVPSPQGDAPGDNPQQAWSYDKTMLPGKSLLKSKSKADLKDKQVDALVDRAKKLQVESPQDQRFKEYMKARGERNRDYWKENAANTQRSKAVVRHNAEMQRQEVEKAVEEARRQWEQLRLEEQAKKDAEIEATALAAAEEERARKAAEEEAKVKAEQEAEGARKAAAAAAHVTKQILIRPLDSEWADRVQKMMDLRDKDAVVATSMDGTELRRHDFGSLLPQEGTSDDASGWLNDEIVNAFIAAVVTRKQEHAGYKRGANNVPPFEFYNSAWYTSYKKAGSISAIGRWSKRKGIQGAKLLKAEKIFFPINSGGHWMLLVVSPKARDIEFVDSMSRNPTGYMKAAREWLAMELGEKYVADEWTETAGRGSKQANSDDCGVFVAMNSLAAGNGYAFGDVTAAKMPDARKMVAAVLINGGLRGDWEL